jgi:hypothetical protein
VRLRDWSALTLGLALVATALAYAHPAHPARASAAASSAHWELKTGVQCGSAQQPAGDGCWDKTSDSSWSVSGDSATYTGPTYNGHYTWTVPSQIPVDGSGAVSLGVQTNDVSNNSGYQGQICVSGDFSVQEGSDPCARAYAMTPGSSASASKTFHLLGNSNSSSVGQIQIGFGSGYVHFFYALVTPPPPPPPPGPPLPSAKERCLGKGYAADIARVTARPRAHTAALNEVRVVKVCPDVQFHKGGTPADAWLPAEVNTVLKQGDEITCDPDGVIVLAFADNSTVVVSNTTQLKIASFFTDGGVVRTEILLKMGEVAAQVNKSEATKSDFRIKSPTDVSSVRGEGDAGARAAASAPGVYAGSGSAFTVFYAPGSKTELVSAKAGPVAFAPSNPSLQAVVVPAGDSVEATPTYESPLGPIGHVGTRGGNDIVAAQERVSAVVGKARKACHDRTAHGYAFSIMPASNGWTVSVKIGGRTRGTALFSVTGSTVTPVNALARKIVGGCARGTSRRR